MSINDDSNKFFVSPFISDGGGCKGGVGFDATPPLGFFGLFGGNPSVHSNTLSRYLVYPKIANDGHSCDRKFLTLQCVCCGHNRPIRTGSLDRTCPKCSKILFKRLFDKYVDRISKCRDLKLLTLTSRPMLHQTADHVHKMFYWLQLLFDRKLYKKAWVGKLAVLECKKTESGLFYYHIHIILSGKYVNQARISEDWRLISGHPIVDIRKIWRTPRNAVSYVLKYVMKGTGYFTVKDVEEFKKSMFRVKYVHSYGSWYGKEYEKAVHVSFPCHICGALDSMVIFEYFNGIIDLREGIGYSDPPGFLS